MFKPATKSYKRKCYHLVTIFFPMITHIVLPNPTVKVAALQSPSKSALKQIVRDSATEEDTSDIGEPC